MPGKRTSSGKRAGRDVVEINVTGNQNAVATHGGKASVQISPAVQGDWDAWRTRMEQEIRSLQSLPAEDQDMLVQSVGQIAKEAEKGGQADPTRIEKLLNTMAVMAPDILQVAVATLANPLAGIGLAAQKIGEKARVTPGA